MQVKALAVIAALDDEIRILKSKLEVDSRVHIRPAVYESGKLLGGPIILVRSGVGAVAMAAATEHLISNYDPSLIIHVGCCGGTDPRDGVGDLVIARFIVDAATGERSECDEKLVEQAQKICSEKNLRARVGGLVTVDAPVSSPHEKAFVGTRYEAIGIDMESAALARACEAKGQAYLVVRAVLDPLDVKLPEVGDIIDEEGKPDGIALAKHIFKRPADILSIPRIGYFEILVRRSIAEFIEAWIESGRL